MFQWVCNKKLANIDISVRSIESVCRAARFGSIQSTP